MAILYGIIYVFLNYQGITGWISSRHQFINAKNRTWQIQALIFAGLSIYLFIWSLWHAYLLFTQGTYGIF